MSGARDHQAAAGAATSISSTAATPSTAAMTIPEPMYSWTPARCSARTGAARTKVKTIAIAIGSRSGRACSKRKTVAMKSRPRPTHVVATARVEGSIAIGAMARAMMAWPLPCRGDDDPSRRRDGRQCAAGG